MPAEKITITLDRERLEEIDCRVSSGPYGSPSRAIEEAVRHHQRASATT